MVRSFRFAVLSDPHIALPQTILNSAHRFHLVEVSIPCLEHILQRLVQAAPDFLLIPGDLTQHGERENHHWLVERLRRLPFPTYVVPGNHDMLTRTGCDRTLGLHEFPGLYQRYGYPNPNRPYYCQEVVPGVHLIGLNSIAFDEAGAQIPVGYVDDAQLDWLAETLTRLRGQWAIAAIHHNVLEHLPGQANHPLGQRYIVKNRQALIERLRAGGVQLVFTGHLHVQDVAQMDGLWEITTGSLVSYPHPYRLVTVTPQAEGLQVQVETQRVPAVPDWPDLQHRSWQWMRDRAVPFMTRLLTSPPFCLSPQEADKIAPELRDFWASISAGDASFDYGHLPPAVRRHLRTFGAIDTDGNHHPIDNQATLLLR